MRADEVFAETIGREGLSEWGSFFSADGAVIQEGAGEIQGLEAIQASADAAAGAVTSFTWAPERAEVSEGGDLGYTVGAFRTTAMGPDSVEMVTTGMYVSIWRRQADGSWKVEMDLGNPVTGPEPLAPEGAGGGGS
jgi:ketosteroid isomerase-like protein